MRRSRFRRILAALIATLAATAAGTLLTVSASSAATTSTPARASQSDHLVTVTAPMEEVPVAKLVSGTPDKAGQVRVQLANGAIVAIPQADEKKVMSRAAQEAAHPDGTVYGDCGRSYITLSEKPDGNPVAMRTGFTVYTWAVEYAWSASVSGPDDYFYFYEDGGPLDFDTSWNGGYQSSQDEPQGTYSAEVYSFGSIAILWDDDICFSGGPTAEAYLTAKAHCLNSRPAGAASTGTGWIENTVTAVPHVNITTTPDGPGHRAATATACLTKPLVGGAGAGGDITGWADAQLFASENGFNPPSDYLARCHLIANVLGGRGIGANLVPCWQRGTNTGRGSMETPYEADVRAAVNALTSKEEAVYFQVTPRYFDSDSTIPYEIVLTAEVERTNGTSTRIFSGVVDNIPTGQPIYNLGN
jgi:hypothetical protein